MVWLLQAKFLIKFDRNEIIYSIFICLGIYIVYLLNYEMEMKFWEEAQSYNDS